MASFKDSCLRVVFAIGMISLTMMFFSEETTGQREVRKERALAEKSFRKGLKFLAKDYCDGALQYFERAVELDSNYAEAWAQIGFCREKLGRHKEAIEASKRAVSLRPSAESYFNIGIASYYLKQYRDAVENYQQVIKLDPSIAADTYYVLGFVYRDWGRPDDEIRAYQQAIRLKPGYIKAYERLGSAYERLKTYPLALETYEQLATLNPSGSHVPFSIGRIGEIYLELGQPSDAVEAFKRAIKLKPDFGKAYYNLGRAYLTLGNRNEALKQYKLLQRIDQEWAEKLDELINPK